MLADPVDTSAVAQAGPNRVRARPQADNAAMAAACDRHAPRCRYDPNSVVDYRFHLDDLSTVDCCHPSLRGQATQTQVTWDASYRS